MKEPKFGDGFTNDQKDLLRKGTLKSLRLVDNAIKSLELAKKEKREKDLVLKALFKIENLVDQQKDLNEVIARYRKIKDVIKDGLYFKVGEKGNCTDNIAYVPTCLWRFVTFQGGLDDDIYICKNHFFRLDMDLKSKVIIHEVGHVAFGAESRHEVLGRYGSHKYSANSTKNLVKAVEGYARYALFISPYGSKALSSTLVKID